MGIADSLLRNVARGGDVLLQECGRGGQRRSDIVKPFHLQVLRQDVLLVDFHAEQRVYRGRELGAVQALRRDVAGGAAVVIGVELG